MAVILSDENSEVGGRSRQCRSVCHSTGNLERIACWAFGAYRADWPLNPLWPQGTRRNSEYQIGICGRASVVDRWSMACRKTNSAHTHDLA